MSNKILGPDLNQSGAMMNVNEIIVNRVGSIKEVELSVSCEDRPMFILCLSADQALALMKSIQVEEENLRKILN
jgi:uncharacterized membrane protein YjjP (DUF1212 family)